MNNDNKISDWIYPLTFQITIVLIWFLTVQFNIVDKYILPDPLSVIKTFFQIFPDIIHHLSATIIESVTGLLLAVLLALPIAILMDEAVFFKKGFYPLLIISQTIPIIVIAPLIIMWFGYGIISKIAVVVLICIFPVILSFYEGLLQTDFDQINLLITMGANRKQIFRFIKFPSALPPFFTGLKIAATYSVMGAVISEWLGGEKGLGVYMTRVRYSFDLNKVFAVTLYIVILSLLLVFIVKIVEKLAIPWKNDIKN